MRSTERVFYALKAKNKEAKSSDFYNDFTVVVSPRAAIIESPSAKSPNSQLKSPTNLISSIPDGMKVSEIPKGQKDEWIIVDHISPKSGKK